MSFLIITCPSKYHSSLSLSGDVNPKWAGLTPKQGQEYLRVTYARIRAQLEREGIKPYGIRVAEPHHDGTTHWHLLIFLPKHHKEKLLEVYCSYCLEEDGDEKGAEKNRLNVKVIDKNKGSAAGYIAKYISKNIDGFGLEQGIYGEDPQDTAARVNAWAACWRIRQFQQVGGASVTVWREIRRLKAVCKFDEVVQQIYKAADKADWKSFNQVMGGVWCQLKDRPLRVLYKQEVDKTTGELKTNYYKDAFCRRLKGLLHEGKEIVTRHFEWRLVKGSSSSALLGVL